MNYLFRFKYNTFSSKKHPQLLDLIIINFLKLEYMLIRKKNSCFFFNIIFFLFEFYP